MLTIHAITDNGYTAHVDISTLSDRDLGNTRGTTREFAIEHANRVLGTPYAELRERVAEALRLHRAILRAQQQEHDRLDAAGQKLLERWTCKSCGCVHSHAWFCNR